MMISELERPTAEKATESGPSERQVLVFARRAAGNWRPGDGHAEEETLEIRQREERAGWLKAAIRAAIDGNFAAVIFFPDNDAAELSESALRTLAEPVLRSECDAVITRSAQPSLRSRAAARAMNRFLGCELISLERGASSFAVTALRSVPFERNVGDDELELLIQLLSAGHRARVEVHPEGMPLRSLTIRELGSALGLAARSRLQRFELFYDRRFDTEPAKIAYAPKFDFDSSHRLAFEATRAEDRMLILGSGPLELVAPFLAKASAVTAVDRSVSESLRQECRTLEADLNTADLNSMFAAADPTLVLLLDIVEHLASPEAFLEELGKAPKGRSCRFVFTVPNVAFLPIRLMLLAGYFQYGKRGILDMTHTRLFTERSFRRLLRESGFVLTRVDGVPAPYPLALGRGSLLGRILLRLNRLAIVIARRMFSYQLYFEADTLPTNGGRL